MFPSPEESSSTRTPESDGPRFTAIAAMLVENEEWLMTRILDYAVARGYARYTSTLKEPWRLSISSLTAAVVESFTGRVDALELQADEEYGADPATRLGIETARRHRERGVSMALFLGLLKYYRQAYQDLLDTLALSAHDTAWLHCTVARFFDRVEISVCSSWVQLGDQQTIDELQQRNRLMTNEKNRYLTIFQSLSLPVLIVDERGRISEMNHAATALLEPSAVPGDAYYRPEQSLPAFAVAYPWLADHYYQFIGSGAQKQSLTVSTPDLRHHFAVSLSRMLDISGKFEGTIIMFEDISEQKRIEQELVTQAMTDPLTGARNRRSFMHHLRKEFSRLQRYGHPFALLLLDVDHFKTINDRFGHDVGDRVLMGAVSSSLETLRETDIFGRWGGEEFIVLLPETSAERALGVAERLRGQLATLQIPTEDDTSVTFTVSIGLHVMTQAQAAEASIDDLLRSVDEALYLAKYKGRNRVVSFADRLV